MHRPAPVRYPIAIEECVCLALASSLGLMQVTPACLAGLPGTMFKQVAQWCL